MKGLRVLASAATANPTMAARPAAPVHDRITADGRMVMKLPSAPVPSSQARAGRLKKAQGGLSMNAAEKDSATAKAQQTMNARRPPSR